MTLAIFVWTLSDAIGVGVATFFVALYGLIKLVDWLREKR